MKEFDFNRLSCDILKQKKEVIWKKELFCLGAML